MSDKKPLIEKIKNAALAKIRENYNDLPYHNEIHTEFVIKAAELLAEDIGLSDEEKGLVTLAAAAHDIIQDHNPLLSNYDGQNERASADWITAKMKEAGTFTEDQIKQVKNAILATYVKHREELRQSAEVGAIISEIICDADLANLGSPWEVYLPKMATYFHEIFPNSTPQDWHLYLEEQIPILRQHHYYTSAAQKRFHHLRENAQKIEEMLQNPEEVERNLIYHE